MTFLLDTTILSELRRPRPAAGLTAWFDRQDADDLFVSVLTLGEIREGVERLRTKEAARARTLDAWLTTLTTVYSDRLLPVDETVAEAWGRLRADVRRSVPVIDTMLAATARVHGLTIVSRNERDFAGLGVPVFNPK
ncbi:MAG: type II toxin-antitoxin system VapC family toxin [Acidobacteria bacterium]|nr:type II toxin-antitoxin system VapC family toxin [Acidobacteriota bacterium]